jgi:YVTN family beta-propeller protein
MRFCHLLALGLCITMSGLLNQTGTAAPPHYHVIDRIKLGGEGGWDYLTVDSHARRIYISRSTHVMVVEEDSGKTLGDIANTAGVHGIALVPALDRGFTSNGRDATVTVFDLKSLQSVAKVLVGQNPDAIIYDPASKRIFTSNGASRDMSVIDPDTYMVVGTIPLGGRPEFAVADEKGHVYVNLEDKSTVVEIDTKTLAVMARWPLAPGESPTGIAMDREARRLFVGCGNKLLVVMNADTGAVVTSLPIGAGVDATAFDAKQKLVFSSNGEGTLTVIREEGSDKFSVAENVETMRGARTMALDVDSGRVFLVTAEFGPAPPPTPERPRPRPSIVPDTFTMLVVGP